MSLEVVKRYGKRRLLCVSRDKERTLVLGTSGSGKSVFANNTAIVAKKDLNYKVIYLTEKAGGEFENAFMTFPPSMAWHKRELKERGIKPDPQKVEIYVPFSFELSKKFEYPSCIKFYTIPIKNVHLESWGALLNQPASSETSKACYDAANWIKDDEGIFELTKRLYDKIIGIKDSTNLKFSNEGMGLPVGDPGDVDTLRRIQGSTKEIIDKHFLLSKNDEITNIDWRSIINDQETVTFISYNGVKNKQLRYFLIVQNLLSLQESLRYAKHPVLIVNEEVKNLLPRTSSNISAFHNILLEAIREFHDLSRSLGRGVATLNTSQSDSDTNNIFLTGLSETVFFRMNAQDSKRRQSSGEITIDMKNKLENLARGVCIPSSLLNAKEWGSGKKTFLTMMPPFGHKEEEMPNFTTVWKNHKMPTKTVGELINYRREKLQEFKNSLREWQRELRKKAIKKAEEKKKKKEKVVEEKVVVKTDSVGDIDAFAYDLVLNNPDMSWTKILKKVPKFKHVRTLQDRVYNYAKKNGKLRPIKKKFSDEYVLSKGR